MSEYYLIARAGAGAITEVSDSDKDYIDFKACARPPIKPIKIYETFKPEGDYDTPEFMQFPATGLSTRVVFEAGLQYTYGINWVAANLTNNKINRDYLFINYLQQIKCVDLIHSEYNSIRSDGAIRSLEKLVLDDALLANIPLNQRLIFMMQESAGILFHRSVVERIMATNPINTTFKPCEQFI